MLQNTIFRAVLLFMGVLFEYPIIVHVDKVGDIFLLDNTLVSKLTNHIYMYHHLIHDWIEDITVIN